MELPLESERIRRSPNKLMTSQELIKKTLQTEVLQQEESRAPTAHLTLGSDIHSPTTKNSSIKEEFSSTFEDRMLPNLTQDSKCQHTITFQYEVKEAKTQKTDTKHISESSSTSTQNEMPC